MTKTLRILYVSQYYPPEVNAPAVRVSGFAKEWATQGHQVTVLTAFPNHPSGRIPESYSGKWFLREVQDGVTILRSFIHAAPNRGFARRVLCYVSFMISAIITGILKTGKQDVIIATSPQFLVAVAGYVISRIKRIPFVFEVRDIWPEEIVAVGALKRGLLVRGLEKLEMFLYRRAALIVAVAEGTIESLTRRGIEREKVVLLPNGCAVERFGDCEVNHEIRDRLGLNGHFLVSYIGTHGMAHNLRTVLQAADRLRKHRDIRFLFVGDGAEREQLVGIKNRLSLDNVTFVSQQSQQRIPEFYATSDVCLVPLRRAALFTRNVPSKVYEIMAAGKAILIGTEGESRQLVESAQAGVAFEPDNDNDLAEKVLQLYSNRDLARRLGANGREFAKANCRQADIAQRYGETLAKLVEGRV